MDEELGGDAIGRLAADLSGAKLKDARRSARAVQVLMRLAKKPNRSLPDAMETGAEVEGAYRFFNNEAVGFEALMESHSNAVAARSVGLEPLLAIHDTTQVHFGKGDPKRIGYLATGKAGFLLHLTLLADVSESEWRRPLGVVHAETLRRRKRARRGKGKKSGSETAKWEGKESERWLRGVLASEERMKGKAAVIHVADRESDQYGLLAPMVEASLRYVFRVKHDRVVQSEGERLHLRELVERSEAVFEREVPLSRRLEQSAPVARKTYPKREARIARLKVACAAAELRRPNYYGDELPAHVAVNVVHVYEVDAPAGIAPVDWLLYTSEPIETEAQLAKVVDYYRARWLIEELNKALKTGCAVEMRELESYEALVNLIALSLPIAVELLALRSLARSATDQPASKLFSKGQLDALRRRSYRPLPTNPTAKEALWCIAGIGGHLKNNGDPGWQVLQRGMTDFLLFAAGWCAREEK